MNCVTCGHTNRAEAKFCEECGKGLGLVCENCASELRPEAKFCDSCGTAVARAIALTQDTSIRAATPRHISEAIRRDHASMEGERRVVTVLFADAVGHTSIAEQLDEEEVYRLMQGCFERMQNAVHQFEGTVNQFTGDGILALFGAPIAHEDSARRAVSAALTMQKSLAAYAEEVKGRHPIQCAYRIGLNTGPVVVGKISDDLDLDFAAVGDTVNLAARMESMAESGTVYLTENTYRVVKDYFEFDRVGELEIKGKAKPVVSYRALREKAVRKRLEAAALHGLTPYVGRERELNIFGEYLKQAKRSHGQIVLLSGEAGMGKSRLLLQFSGTALSEDIKWLEGHCASYGRMTPYLPFIDIIKRNFGIQEGDNDEAIIEKVAEGTSEWDPSRQSASPYLRFLLNVDPGDNKVAGMDPMERRAGVLDALRALLFEESTVKTLVVVVEDLHWIDEKSEEALTTLVDAVASLPVLLILTSRPGYRHRFGERSYFSRLALSYLPSEESASMVEGVLEAGSLPPQLLNLISKKAEGNPFYIEEVTKSLVESGVLQKQNGGFRLERSLDQIRVPDTIQEVILARIDRLDRNARGVMQLASVIGREFTARLLNRIADLESELDELLRDLKGLELIYETGYSSEVSYMFKHALTHDVAYSTLLIERRRALHRIVAKAIEELYPDRLPEHFEALAHHYERGESWEKALDYLDKAGDKAVSAYANTDAIDFYGRALKACEKVGDSTQDRVLAISEKCGWVNFGIAAYDAAIERVATIIDICKQNGNEPGESRAHALKGFFEIYAHEFEAAEASMTRTVVLAEKLGIEPTLFMGRSGLYSIQKLVNRHEEAKAQLQLIERMEVPLNEPFTLSQWTFFSSLDENWKGNYATAVERAQRWRQFPAQTPEIMILHVRWSEALTFAGMGRYAQALTALQQIAADCARMGEVAVQARALNTMGWIYGELHDDSRSMEYNHQGVEVALQEGDEPEKISNARLNWADTLIDLERFSEAQEIFTEIENVIRNPKPHDRWMLWRYSQHFFHSYGTLRLAQGEFDKALSLADECLQLAEPSESKKYIVKGKRLRGQALGKQGDFGAASRELDAAVRMASAIGNPPQLWKTHIALGELLSARSKNAEAAEAYRNARNVIDKVAEELQDESLQNTFLRSKEAEGIRAASE